MSAKKDLWGFRAYIMHRGIEIFGTHVKFPNKINLANNFHVK